MVRKSLAAAILSLGLAAAPAFAQSQANPGAVSEDSEAARTMAQNRQVLIRRPAAPPDTAQNLPREAAGAAKPTAAAPRPVKLVENARR